MSNVGQNAKKRTFFEFVMHFLFRKMRWEMKQMPKKVSKIMFCFTTCTPKIEKVQILSRVTFASIKAKVKCSVVLLFALMSGVHELLGHALCPHFAEGERILLDFPYLGKWKLS